MFPNHRWRKASRRAPCVRVLRSDRTPLAPSLRTVLAVHSHGVVQPARFSSFVRPLFCGRINASTTTHSVRTRRHTSLSLICKLRSCSVLRADRRGFFWKSIVAVHRPGVSGYRVFFSAAFTSGRRRSLQLPRVPLSSCRFNPTTVIRRESVCDVSCCLSLRRLRPDDLLSNLEDALSESAFSRLDMAATVSDVLP